MKAKGMRILSDTKMQEQLDDMMKVNNNVSKQSFIGGGMADDIVNDTIDSLEFSMSFLKSKDMEEQTGIIEVVYVYYPFDEGGNIEPQYVDGFLLKVDLPFDGTEGINNFINSPATGKYLHKHWVRKMPLWVSTGVSMIEMIVT